MKRGATEMRTIFDYGDLEAVAKKVLDSIFENLEGEWEFGPGWNRARIALEAVQGVAFSAK